MRRQDAVRQSVKSGRGLLPEDEEVWRACTAPRNGPGYGQSATPGGQAGTRLQLWVGDALGR